MTGVAGPSRVALLLVSVGDLAGSGGTERQFADVFQHLRRRGGAHPQLVTSSAGLARLRAAGRVAASDGVLALPLGGGPIRGVLGHLWLTTALLAAAVWHRWELVHICQPTPAYVPFAAVMARLPRWLRPRVTLTVVDCTLAHNLARPSPPEDQYERQVLAAHALYAKWTRPDGIFSWYEAFAEQARIRGEFPGATVTAAKYCFTDPARFVPGTKVPLVVFAGRFSEQKRPLLFIDAVASLVRRHPELTADWRFAMYGGGPLESAIHARLAAHGLEGRVEVTRTADMAPVFAVSRLFVSTQAYENFTSLAMLEAMAAGNAVIAERVGQTGQFVRDGENGAVVSPPTADAFADAMAAYLAHPESHDRMAAASRAIATEIHTVDHFSDDLLAFWRDVASR